MSTVGADSPDQHGNICPLAASICVEFVKDQETKVLVYAIPDFTFTDSSQQQFQHHVVGKQDLRWILPHFSTGIFTFLAGVLAKLGVQSAFVVHGDGGLDEVSLSGPAKISEVKNGAVHTYYLDPAEHGFARIPASELRGGDAADNAEITRSILQGAPGPQREIVVINSALALMAAGKVGNVGEGIILAQNVITQGLAHDKLTELISCSNEFRTNAASVV